jgi:hypothetical protein
MQESAEEELVGQEAVSSEEEGGVKLFEKAKRPL